MARKRELNRIQPGEYQATVLWSSGTGIEERPRYAECTGVKIMDKWAYIYLHDGEEIVKLSRTRNHSAQVYVDMSLRDAVRERIVNGVEGGSPCCWGRFGWARNSGGEESLWSGDRTPCPLHTPEWLEERIDERVAEFISDEDWASVLAQRQIDAAKAQEALAQAAKERDEARVSGFAEWRKDGREWLVSVDDRSVGEIIPVRRRNGTVSWHELTVQVSPKLFRVGDEIQEAEVELRRTKKVIPFVPSATPMPVIPETKRPVVKFTPSPMPRNVLPESRKQPRLIQNRDGSWVPE